MSSSPHLHTGSVDPVPLWIDCDPGHDDAFALLLASSNPKLRLLGVSTVHGNAGVQATTSNALSVLAAIGHSDVPVYMGAASPLSRPREGAEKFHGSTGLAGTDLLPQRTFEDAVPDASAIKAMRDALMAQPRHTAWLVAIAPVTNIAQLLSDYPEVADWVKGLNIMGGALGGGYTSAILGKDGDEGQLVTHPSRWAEFNTWCDPEAASMVFTNPILTPKITLVTLDLTHQIIAGGEVYALLQPSQDPNVARRGKVRQMFLELLQYNHKKYQTYFPNLSGPPLHDPVAVALTLPDCRDRSDGETFRIDVVTEGEERGRTVGTAVRPGSGVWVPKQINPDILWGLLAGALDAVER